MLTDLTLHTPRLALIPLSSAQLRLAMEDACLLAKDLGLAVVPDLVTAPARRAITIKLEKINHAPPQDLPWYTYWLIVVQQDDKQTGAGMAGFKGAPGILGEPGSVEIGYGIDPAFRRKGYMTETVRAMIDWAFRQPGCTRVTACQVLKTNPASSHVLLNAGMTLFDEDQETFSYHIQREDWQKQEL